jgi:hypothetical protein
MRWAGAGMAQASTPSIGRRERGQSLSRADAATCATDWLGWSHSRRRGVAPLLEEVQIAKAVNATVITLDDAPQGYKDLDSGVAKKFVFDPNGLINT